jgi:hypothetical protein
MTCPTCGKDPCATPGFCTTCEKREAEDLGAQLAAKLAEQREEQLKELAAKTPIDYDQNRQQVAKELGVRTETLDKEVAKRRRRPSEKKPADDGKEKEIKELERAAGDLIGDPDILERFGKAVQACGLIGETENAKILFLALTSRLFERPVSIAIKGISAGGKSFTVETVLRFFPAEAYFERTGMSEHALPYSDENFQHRHIVIYEHAGMANETASYHIRTLLSENRLSYETVEKTEDGLKARVIVKLGPTGLITTTTAASLHPENETRLLSLGVVDSPAQTAAVMRALGRRAASGDTPGGDLTEWEAFQRWLALGERRVVIPYAVALSDKIPPVAVRLRRDFSTVLALIAAHALLHRSTRAADQQGRIIATPADYAAVHGLVAELFAEGIEATVPPIVRETVEAVREVTVGVGVLEPQEVSLTLLAKKLGLDKNSAHHRVRKAIERGYLVNREEKRGKPARIALADPLPDELEILPNPTALGCWSANEGVKEGEAAPAEIRYVTVPIFHETTEYSPNIALKSTAKTEKQSESEGLPEATITGAPAPLNPPKNTSNTPTPSDGGNGQTVWPRAISHSPEDRQEPSPGAVFANVEIREVWAPGLGPAGDDVFDLD